MSSKEKDSCHKRNKDRRQTEVKSRSPKISTTTEPVNDDGKTRQDAAERQKQGQGSVTKAECFTFNEAVRYAFNIK